MSLTAFTPAKEWEPKYYTKPLYERSEGKFAVKIAENYLTAIDGFREGLPIHLGDWQKTVIENILELNNDNSFRYKKFLLMVPRKNGKTFLAAILIIYHLLTAPKRAQIYSAGKDREQAMIVFDMVKAFIEDSPLLRKKFKLIKSKNMFVNVKTKAYYKPLSADSGKVHGINPYFVVADEPHTWEGLGAGIRANEFWKGLTSGSGARKSSQIVVISTAGANMYGSILGNLYLKGVDVVKGDDPDPYFGFWCWEADESDNPLEYETWVKANPNLAEGLLSRENIESEMYTAIAVGMAGFLRLHLNIWAKQEGDPFINPFYWQEAVKENYKIPLGSKITVGIDSAQTADTMSISIMEADGVNAFHENYAFWEKDESDETWAINRDEVEQKLIELHRNYDVQLIWIDAAYWYPDVRNWRKKHGWNITEVPPTDSQMAPLAREFLQDLVEGEISHGNDYDVNRYAFRALLRENGSFGKASKKPQDRIDLLVSFILANGARNWVLNQEPAEAFILY